MTPSGWKKRTLEKLSHKKISYGIVQTGEPVESGVRCLRVVDITKPKFDLEDLITTSEDISQSYKRTILEKGEIVLALRGEIGRSILIDGDLVGCNLTRGLARIAPNGEVESGFLLHSLHSPLVQQELKLRTNGSALQEIPINELRRVTILVPPLPEQRKIAAILSTWNRAIELTKKLIDAKQNRKLALMQRLLTGKMRLPGYEESTWTTCHLGDVAKNSSRRNGATTAGRTVYSVTNSVGMVPMEEGLIGENIDRYKKVSRFDFAYNPMRINVGSIAMWADEEEVLVSPDYVVFRCGPKMDPQFLNHYRQTHHWRHFVNSSGGGSVRVRIYFDDLASMKLKLPPIQEQRAIAAVLNIQDEEIDLLKKRLDALKRQMKGLLQQLLTGKVRVNNVEVPPED